MIFVATPKLYFENAVGRVLEHPEGFVIFEYKPGPRQFSDLQALLTHTRNLFERNNWNRLLGDQRHMAPFSEEESSWIVNHWLDSSRQGPNGLFGAILLNSSDFSQYPPEQVMQEAQTAALTYRVFVDEVEATTWLTRTVPELLAAREQAGTDGIGPEKA